MSHRNRTPFRFLAILGPGLLVAATGVGAGDLATGAFAGSKLGVAVLWAVLVGAGLKFVLNEGLVRWQLATGDTLLEGIVRHFGSWAQILFLLYLLMWSYFVGSALMSACGITAHAIFPQALTQPIVIGHGDGARTILSGKIMFGLLHSAIAVVLVRRGGYRLFEKVMRVCIAVMFATVVVTAVAIGPNWGDVVRGLFVPSVAATAGDELQWTVALMGGVGGTLTILCYGYWIREEGRRGPEQLTVCRWDLAAGYLMTALFGGAMVIIGSRVEVAGGGAQLIVQLADQLESELGRFGTTARWAFLIGSWGAVFSSLLGVWQSVPYLFADFWSLTRGARRPGDDIPIDTASRPYRLYLYGLAVIPAVGLWGKFDAVQKAYALFGACFIPLLAVALLILNGRASLVGSAWTNRWSTTMVLAAAVLFFVLAGWFELQEKVFS